MGRLTLIKIPLDAGYGEATGARQPP